MGLEWKQRAYGIPFSDMKLNIIYYWMGQDQQLAAVVLSAILTFAMHIKCICL